MTETTTTTTTKKTTGPKKGSKRIMRSTANGKRKQFNVTLPEDLATRVPAITKKKNVSYSAWFESAVKKELNPTTTTNPKNATPIIKDQSFRQILRDEIENTLVGMLRE